MAKNLKFNIKNLQLAGALKSKSPASTEENDAPKKEGGEKEQKKRVSRLKEDATISSALKQAEKTLAAREKEVEAGAIKKRKTRIVQAPSSEGEEAKGEKEGAGFT